MTVVVRADLEGTAWQLVHRLLGRHTGAVLTSASVVIRAAALALIGAALFIGPTAHGSARAAQLGCFAIGTVTVLLWAALVRRGSRPDDGRLLAVFAVMAAAALAGTTAHGGGLIAFAIMAAVVAGASSGLVGGCVVAGVGVLAVTIGAIATGAAAVGTIGSCLEVVVALFLGRSRRAYRIQAEQSALLLAQAEELRAEQAQVATLGERARIAREIHDVLAHSLGALGIQIQAAQALLTERRDPDQALTVLNRAQRIAAEGLDETRRAVHALRTDGRPLDQELAALAETHRGIHQVPVDFRIHGEIQPLAPDATLALLRTAQESLVNAAKHSSGQPITVDLTYDPAGTHLQVTNALGESGTPGHELGTVGGGYGLLGMGERLRLLHGSLSASSRAGRWEVTAQVPR